MRIEFGEERTLVQRDYTLVHTTGFSKSNERYFQGQLNSFGQIHSLPDRHSPALSHTKHVPILCNPHNAAHAYANRERGRSTYEYRPKTETFRSDLHCTLQHLHSHNHDHTALQWQENWHNQLWLRQPKHWNSKLVLDDTAHTPGTQDE